MSQPYDQYSMAFFAADFPTDFGNKLPACAAAFNAKFKPDDLQFRPSTTYTFQWWKQRKLAILQNVPGTRIGYQTLGLDVWRNNLQEFVEYTNLVAGELAAEECKRIGFKTIAFLPQTMTHEEMSDLFFGTFLSSVDTWRNICESPNDPIVQLNGTIDGMKLVLNVTPSTIEQTLTSVTSQGNFDKFVKSHVSDSTAIDFARRVTVNSAFMVDLDLYKDATPTSGVAEFFDASLNATDKIIASCKNTFLSKAQ